MCSLCCSHFEARCHAHVNNLAHHHHAARHGCRAHHHHAALHGGRFYGCHAWRLVAVYVMATSRRLMEVILAQWLRCETTPSGLCTLVTRPRICFVVSSVRRTSTFLTKAIIYNVSMVRSGPVTLVTTGVVLSCSPVRAPSYKFPWVNSESYRSQWLGNCHSLWRDAFTSSNGW